MLSVWEDTTIVCLTSGLLMDFMLRYSIAQSFTISNPAFLSRDFGELVYM